jgi:hypothetical protein
MPNQPDPEKERIIYLEWTDVRDELTKIRQEIAAEEGVPELTEAEFLRRLTIDYINDRRKSHKKKLMLRDPASTPGGVRKATSHRQLA